MSEATSGCDTCLLCFNQISQHSIRVIVVDLLLLVNDVLELLPPINDDLRSQITNLAFPIEMGLFVGGKVATLREPLVAVRIVAHVRFLSRVSPQVRPQIEVQ